MGLGLAAANTGNNLLYLLVATLLGLIVASGVLSEQSMRGLKLARVIPGEIFAGQAALVGLVLTNTKRWLSTHSVAVESLGISGAGGRYVSRLEPGQEALLTVEERFPRRGRHQLPRVRVVTRFPFGLFLKMSHPLPSQEVLVYPAVRPLAPESLRGIESGWAEPERRAGQGAELHNLRDYQWGDDPRLIHWKSSAKAETLVIRELEAETARAVRLVLEPGHGRSAPDLLEAALSWAASSIESRPTSSSRFIDSASPRSALPSSRTRSRSSAVRSCSCWASVSIRSTPFPSRAGRRQVETGATCRRLSSPSSPG
jgi:uncharacterized protein (DUF58 family)